MAISAQDKILYVANKLGLSTLKNMQGSTGAVYDNDPTGDGILFANVGSHAFPAETNLSDNKFEVNSALLIESIAFYSNGPDGSCQNLTSGPLGHDSIIVFDLIIGNKVVMKDTPIWTAGTMSTFSQTPLYSNGAPFPDTADVRNPKHQIFLEGAGILIPPQVEFSINYSAYNVFSGVKLDAGFTQYIGAYLFGTRVLLNFNTSI